MLLWPLWSNSLSIHTIPVTAQEHISLLRSVTHPIPPAFLQMLCCGVVQVLAPFLRLSRVVLGLNSLANLVRLCPVWQPVESSLA